MARTFIEVCDAINDFKKRHNITYFPRVTVEETDTEIIYTEHFASYCPCCGSKTYEATRIIKRIKR